MNLCALKTMASQDRWEDWFTAHGAALVLFARQWLPDRSDAEDAAQEGFLRFWRSRQEAGDWRAFLYTCIKHCAFDRLRGRRRQRRREEIAAGFRPEVEPGWFVAEAEHAERARILELAMQSLASEQRQVLVLKIWGGLTFPEIGLVLEISPNTIASRYRYALIELRNKLNKETFYER